MADGGPRGITFADIFIGFFLFLSHCSGCPPPQPAEMFISKTVYIESPQYSLGNNYPPNSNCQWLLKTYEDHTIQIEADKIFIEGQPNHCKNKNYSFDYLMIFDGESIYDDILGEFCGDGVKVDVESSKNFVYILFKSDHLVEKRGFKLEISHKLKPNLRPKEKGPNLNAIIGGVVGGVVCSVLFVTFACCCLHTKRCPCRRGNRPNRTVSPHGSRITVQPADRPDRHVRLERSDRQEPTVATISPYLYFNPRSPAAFDRQNPIRMTALSPPPYISGPPPPLESSNSSNSSSSPPPPYTEQDPHPHAVQSDSVPSYSSR